jgi:uncharacterized protein (DUF4415 family)
MTIVKYTVNEMKKLKSKTDWRRVDAMSDEDIARAVESDPDTRFLDEEDFKKMRRRGPQKAPVKAHISIRLNQDVVGFFKAQGKGWQTKVNDVLQDYINNSHSA